MEIFYPPFPFTSPSPTLLNISQRIMTMFGKVLLLRKTSYIFGGDLFDYLAVIINDGCFFCAYFGGFRGICVNQCVNKIGYEHLSIRCFLLIKETIQCQTIKECNLHSFMSIENRFSIFRYGQVPLLSMISYPSDARSKQCRLLRMG